MNGHLCALADLAESHGDERAVVELVRVELRPAVGRTPGEHELLVAHYLAVDAARDVGRALVDDHVLAPDATDTQVQLDRLTRYGIVVLVVTASVAVSTATAAPNGPEARSYTSQAVNADGLRWQALADHHSQLESRPAASFYTPQALKAQGLRWQAMAQTYRTKSPAPAATISRSSGFDWDAALIGAAGSFGLATCATALVLATRRIRRAKPAHS